MRVKVRYITEALPPVVLTLSDTDSISSLLTKIQTSGNLSTSNIEIKHSFPPKLLDLSNYPPSTPLSSLPFKLDGDQLTVRPLDTPSTPEPPPPTTKSFKQKQKPKPNISPAVPNESDPPDAPLPGRGTVVLRVMEDDNSCLFRAISYVLTNGLSSPDELRQIVTSGIQGDPETYSAAVLGQPVDDYCQWISMGSSWGGGIELAILAKFFDIEILAIDVSTLSTMRFNDPRPRCCMLVYSGIHYDALALSPFTDFSSFLPSPDTDICIFERDDEGVLQAAMELAAKLKAKRYFTDTKRFSLRCGVCGTGLVGEEGARRHAKKTGHTEFGEY